MRAIPARISLKFASYKPKSPSLNRRQCSQQLKKFFRWFVVVFLFWMGNYAENEPFSTAERSERVEIWFFRATREYMAAGIEQATDALAPTVQNRPGARCPNVTHERRRPAAIKPHVSDFPGASWVLAQAKRACAVQLAHPPPIFCRFSAPGL